MADTFSILIKKPADSLVTKDKMLGVSQQRDLACINLP